MIARAGSAGMFITLAAHIAAIYVSLMDVFADDAARARMKEA